MKKVYWTLLISLLLKELILIDTSINDQILLREKIVRDLAAITEETYYRRCGLRSDCNLNQFSACSSLTKTATCVNISTKSCGCGGIVLDYEKSSVRLPKGISGISADSVQAKLEIENICYTSSLEPIFKQILNTYKEIDYLSYATWTGLHRRLPGVYQSSCSDYDPRLRSWYVAGSSGPKDIIIVIDTSGSMLLSKNSTSPTRLQLAKDAAHSILQTLNLNDYVGLITFNSVVSRSNSRLVSAISSEIKVISKVIDNLAASGGTNFEAAFNAMFDMIHESRASDSSSKCNTAILFLTDGFPTNGEMNPDKLAQLFQTRNADLNATLFAYSLGNEADRVILKKIACANNGIFTYMQDNSDVRGTMSLFYDYFASLMGANNNITVWASPFINQFTEENMTAAVAPVFDRSTNPPTFLGVVDTGFTFSQFDGDPNQLIYILRDRSTKCPSFFLDQCQLQSIRRRLGSIESLCDVANCTINITLPTACSGAYPDNIWLNTDGKNVSYSTKSCCNCKTNPSNSSTRIHLSLLSLLLPSVFFILLVLLQHFVFF